MLCVRVSLVLTRCSQVKWLLENGVRLFKEIAYRVEGDPVSVAEALFFSSPSASELHA